MTDWEAKMLENFSEAVEDAIAKYLNDKAMALETLREYFGNYTIYDKVIAYREVLEG